MCEVEVDPKRGKPAHEKTIQELAGKNDLWSAAKEAILPRFAFGGQTLRVYAECGVESADGLDSATHFRSRGTTSLTICRGDEKNVQVADAQVISGEYFAG